MNGKISIKDIAQMAGVSTTAVSFAINGRNGISTETRKKILAIIEKTEYSPSIASRRLSSQKSYNIAIIYPASASPFVDMFYIEVVLGITEEVTKNGFNAVMVPIEENATHYKTPMIFQRKDVDGAVLLYSMPNSLLSEIRDYGVPCVFVDWQDADVEGKTVLVNSEESIRLAMQYLLQKGHRKIGFYGSSQYPAYYLRCFNSYRKILTEQQLAVYPHWIQSGINSIGSAMQYLESARDSQNMPTAICCMSDMCAIHTLQAANRLKISVPEELSIISLDDIQMSQYTCPPLTTVSFDKEMIGRESAKLLIRMLNGEDPDSICIRDKNIVERASVMDLRSVSEDADMDGA